MKGFWQKVRPDIGSLHLSLYLNTSQWDKKVEDHYIHLICLYNPPQRFWPVPGLSGALNSDKGSLTWGGDSAQGPCPPRHKSWMYSIWLCSQTNRLALWLARPLPLPLLLYSFFFCSLPALVASVLIALKLSAHLRELNGMFYRALGRLTINK